MIGTALIGYAMGGCEVRIGKGKRTPQHGDERGGKGPNVRTFCA